MTFRRASLTQVRLRNGRLALTATPVGSEPPPPGGNAATDLTLTDVSQPVLQRVGTSRTVNVAFAYTGTPDAVQARAVDYDLGTAITGWTSTASAPTGGTGTIALSIPQGKNYRLQIRDSVDTALIRSGTTRFGVGMINLFTGQSNAVGSTNTADKYPVTDNKTLFEYASSTFRRPGHIPIPDTFPRNSLYPSNYTSYVTTHVSNKGDGPIFWGNLVSDALGIPVLNVIVVAGGTAIDQWLPGGSCWTLVTTAMTAVGGECEHMTYYQGEQDAAAMSTATYKSKLASLHTAVLSLVGRTASNFKLGIMSLATGPYNGSTAGEFGNIRAAQVDFANNTDGVYLLSCAHDGFTNQAFDMVHQEKTTLSKIWRRSAKSTAHQYGIGNSGAGPRITGATRSGTTVTVAIAHTGGSALQDGAGGTGTALTGFQFFDAGAAGAEIAVSASAISGNTVVLTLASAPAGALTMSYAMADAPHGTPTAQGVVLASCVYDNATYLNSGTLGCPLQPLAAITVT